VAPRLGLCVHGSICRVLYSSYFPTTTIVLPTAALTLVQLIRAASARPVALLSSVFMLRLLIQSACHLFASSFSVQDPSPITEYFPSRHPTDFETCQMIAIFSVFAFSPVVFSRLFSQFRAPKRAARFSRGDSRPVLS